MTHQKQWSSLLSGQNSEKIKVEGLPALMPPSPAVRCIAHLDGVTPEAAFSQLADRRGLLWLDSAAAQDRQSQWSFLMTDPCAILKSHGQDTFLTHAAGVWRQQISPLTVLAHFMSQNQDPVGAAQDFEIPPFAGGWAGLITYDYGRKVEQVPMDVADVLNFPDVWMGAYDICLAWQHGSEGLIPERALMISTGWSGTTERDQRERAQNRLRELQQRLAPIQHKPLAPLPKLPNVSVDAWKPVETKEKYQQKISRVKKYIEEGDVFQVNLAQSFEADIPYTWEGSEVYRRIRSITPSPFGGYLHGDGWAIASASPERFVSLSSQGEVEARPIKGTAPRGQTVEEDTAFAKALQESEKDRAENRMILDLLRNDLSKICALGSMTETEICKLETYENVHHLVSSVTAKLEAGFGAADVLAACSPGGSITGAPKKRAMEIIAELETYPRGPYCGNLAYISLSGAMDSNILIRTMILADIDKPSPYAILWGGGGITSLSEPEAEYEETLTKLSSLFRALDLNEEI